VGGFSRRRGSVFNEKKIRGKSLEISLKWCFHRTGWTKHYRKIRISQSWKRGVVEGWGSIWVKKRYRHKKGGNKSDASGSKTPSHQGPARKEVVRDPARRTAL